MYTWTCPLYAHKVAVFPILDVFQEVRVDVDGDTTSDYSPNFGFGTELY